MIEDAKARLARLFGLRRDAEALLDYPAFARAVADVRAAAHAAFENSAPNQAEERHSAYWLLRALDGVETALNNTIAAHELESRLAQKTDERMTRAALRR